jgi:hypothetical protein
MRSDFTDITLVVDRSGSMQSIQDDAQGGINSFIAEQAAQSGSANLTLVQFDTEYEIVHRGVPVSQVSNYKLIPRGSTALLDAVGRTIDETGQRLAAMPEHDRPGLVVFVVVTDGQENSSRQFTRDKVRQMIDHQQSVYNWKFTFLAASPEAFAEAGALGFDAAAVLHHSRQAYVKAYGATGKKVSRMRREMALGQVADNAFLEEERKEVD